MEAIPQTLTFLGLVFMIFLIITTFKLSSTIAELRGRDPDRLLCPECFDAEKRFKKEEVWCQHFDDKTVIRLLSGRVLQSPMSASEIHSIILAAQKNESLLEGRIRDLELENQDLRDKLSKVVTPVPKYKSRLDGMREDAAALAESDILDPEKIKECHDFYRAFDTISDLSRLDLSGMERERLVGFILALLDRVLITDEVKDQLVKNASEGRYASVVVGEAFIDLYRNDGTKDHVKVFFR